MRLVKILCLAALVVTACCDLVDTINILFPEVNDQRQRFPAQIISTEGAFYEWTSSAPEIAAVRKLETKE